MRAQGSERPSQPQAARSRGVAPPVRGLRVLLGVAAGPRDGRVPRAGAVARRCDAGEEVTVRWTPPAADVRELELLLLLDGDAAPVRLTEQLAPQEGIYHWRVPGLPSPAARLQIRFSRGRGEELGSTSAPFRILPRQAGRLADLGRRGGEWWVVTPGAGAVGRLEPPRRGVCAELVAAWPLEPLGSSGEREPLLAPAWLGAGPGSNGTWLSVRPVGGSVMPRAPGDVPQRE